MKNYIEGAVDGTSSKKIALNNLSASVEDSAAMQASQTTLPMIIRQQFFDDVKKVIGNINDTNIPIDIRQILKQMLRLNSLFVQLGNETLFLDLCQRAISSCNQCWGFLSFWVSSEQNRCYEIYWGLKAAEQKYLQSMACYLNSNNSGFSNRDPKSPPSPDLKEASLEMKNPSSLKDADSSMKMVTTFRHFFKQLGAKVKIFHTSVLQQYHSNEIESFDTLACVKDQVFEAKHLEKDHRQ